MFLKWCGTTTRGGIRRALAILLWRCRYFTGISHGTQGSYIEFGKRAGDDWTPPLIIVRVSEDFATEIDHEWDSMLRRTFEERRKEQM